MRIELLPGTTNVVRFPVERRARPTLELLRDIAPDVREVLILAEGFRMEAPVFDLRERTDAATAEHILNQVPTREPQREAILCDLEASVIERAVAACRAGTDASIEAVEAQRALLQARTGGRYWVAPLRERAERLAERAARLLLEAHARVEEAEGAARAIDIARRGETWAPRDHDAGDDALIRIGHRSALNRPRMGS